jgi:RimJ/RimL family protein N-acetyltransferase
MASPAKSLPRHRMAKLKKGLGPNFKIPGKRIYLRPVRVADATPRYCAWLNDPKVNRFTESRYARSTIAGVRKYVKSALRSHANFFFAIIEQGNGEHIGNIKIDSTVNPHWDHRVGEIGLLIGERRCWGKGYGSEAIRLITKFAFERLKLIKVTATCFAINKGSAQAFRKAGFREEILRRRNGWFGGKCIDLILFGAINPRLK